MNAHDACARHNVYSPAGQGLTPRNRYRVSRHHATTPAPHQDGTPRHAFTTRYQDGTSRHAITTCYQDGTPRHAITTRCQDGTPRHSITTRYQDGTPRHAITTPSRGFFGYRG